VKTPILNLSIPSWVGSFLLVLLLLVSRGSELQAQTQSSEQTLAAMDKCREQVISQLSLSDKLKMRAAMGVIQSNPRYITANDAVNNAATPSAKIEARKTLAKIKLDLIEKQDPSLKATVEKIREAQAAVLR
jgi:hypothetical protein